MSNESIKPFTTSNKMLNSSVDYVGTKIRVWFNGDCLKQGKITLNYGKIINIYIVYEIKRSVNISSYPSLEDCLFGGITLTQHVDINLYKYSGYGMLIEKDII